MGGAGKLIAQAVRAGGPDATANAKLREVLQQAKLAQLPTDIIDRNIKKASEKNAADFAEVTYEAYGPGGTGFVIECLTGGFLITHGSSTHVASHGKLLVSTGKTAVSVPASAAVSRSNSLQNHRCSQPCCSCLRCC